MTARGRSDQHAPWFRHVERALRRWRGAAVVVAVSGGGDSVGLLRVVHELAPGLDLRPSVAHLNHSVRGEAAEADAHFVARLAEALGLPCDLGRWSPARPGGFEAEARRARYAWLVEVARERGAAAVAIGHTRDDQAETILHRILRGTGLRGLAGIPARRPLAEGITLIRPLLEVSRAEIRSYLAAIGQDYREDATNTDLSRTRARLRLDLLPKLAAEYNPRIAEALVRLGRLAGARDRALQAELRAVERAAMIRIQPDLVVLDRSILLTLPPRFRAELLRRIWRDRGWPEAAMGAGRWERLAAWVRRTEGALAVGAGIEAIVTRDDLTLRRRRVEGVGAIPPEPVPLPVPGEAPWLGGRIVASLDPSQPSDETIDLDRLEPPLWVSPPRPGDRLDPLGMGGRHQDVGDLLRGRGVPREERGRVPLVRDARGIVWVVGHRIAHRVRRTEATRRTLGLRW
ncbi:MAG: tRNA lysidine(34) synthetase TilS, partial [Isosphaeraceae bacterium]|nr:tRNA lysidine(34) synthetase TilS [Isosphaeraceae bacterium]